MKILLAKTAGFCMGVRRAVDLVLDAANHAQPPIYTFGPLIHNTQVLQILTEKNITILDQIPEKGAGTVLIRAHGIPPEQKRQLMDAGFYVIDATCPRVIKVHNIIKKYATDGYTTIIVGDSIHPEVKGLLGCAQGQGVTIHSIDGFHSLPAYQKAIVVAQTTQDVALFKQISHQIANSYPNYKIFNTICDSTSQRQSEIKQLASIVDTVVVVGGYNSGNTQRLVQIVESQNRKAHHIETETDLNLDLLKDVKSIGITAGASTPNWIIRRVYHEIEMLSYQDQGNSKRLLFKIIQVLLLTNIYIGLGAGCLAWACMLLQEIQPSFNLVCMAFFYIVSMHTLNHLISRKSERYNYPNRAAFYQQYKSLLTLLAFGSGLTGLAITFSHGVVPFIILLIMSLLGLAYQVNIIPVRYDKMTYRSIQDIPGSKTVLIAIAWGIVTAILPGISVDHTSDITTLFVFLGAASIAFVRTAFFDMLDIQGDRIIGRETLPILIGELKTQRLLRSILICLFLCLIISSILKWTPLPGIWFSFIILSLLILFTAYHKGYVVQGTRLEFFVETHFTATGLFSILFFIS